ncbi:MAG: aminopeptidase P family protein, partial [Gemmataceae bacterium]|nr:aminopeptidase P family protein [Gemmataceae bacterium]
MFDLPAVQAALAEEGVDGWLLYDFRGLNVLARRVLRFPADAHASRRWFYFVPARGEPRKLVHRIEQGSLDMVPGPKSVYLRWQELEEGVASLVKGG